MSIWLCRACARSSGTPLAWHSTSATPVSSHEDSTPRMFIARVYGTAPHGPDPAGDTAHNHNLTQNSKRGLPENCREYASRRHEHRLPCASLPSGRPDMATDKQV